MHKQIMRYINHHIQRMNEFCMPCSRMSGIWNFNIHPQVLRAKKPIQTNQTRCQDFATSFPRLRSPQKGFAPALSAKEGDKPQLYCETKGETSFLPTYTAPG